MNESLNIFAQEQTYMPGEYVEEVRVELDRVERQRRYLIGVIAEYEQAGDIPTDVAQTE